MTTPLYDRKAIEDMLPHRPPFLFVDRVLQLTPNQRVVAELDLKGDEPHFAGHFPGRPMMPGVLVSEAMAQTAGILVGLSGKDGKPPERDPNRFIILAAINVKFVKPAFPGDVLTLRASLERTVGQLSHLAVTAYVGKREVASGTVTLVEGKESQWNS